jgi:predicted ATPase/DNA-binding winged helix-turn-helix (wHTH) protein
MSTLYNIGPLQLDPEARVLTQDGAAVALGARGVAVLFALVSRANEYVEKSAILDAAWPGLVVEEANLAVQISAIRRALARVPGGEGWIETLARRGYRFVGPVTAMAGRSAAPPVAADRKRTNLPELLSSFVGRERELAELKQRLPTTRLLTLTGVGGIGKTRLAQQAAAEVLAAYRDGVWFVDLAPLRDPALVPSALAQVLQVTESAGQPLVNALCNHLRTKETLLILDNCEHVLDACARLAEVLLRETAQVTMLATSREPLHLTAEHSYPLAPLPLPDPQADAQSIARSDAVQLFVKRARQHRPHFDLQGQRARSVAEICVRLDGIPLALELAAARVAVLPVEQIVRLLDQRFRLLTSGNRELPRHQTLRAMLDWSFELLDDAEKAVFARLSVFAGGWTLAAATEVCCGAPIAKDEMVYVLIGLIEQSLVVADEDGDRYRMLETVREYAKERLAGGSAADAVRHRHRHRDYFLALAEEVEPKLMGADQATWLQGLDEEHDNLRLALEWSLVNVGSEAGFRLCGALHWFWIVRGHRAEGRAWCERILGKSGGEERTPERAKALNATGLLAYHQGDFSAARAGYEESLAIRRKLNDRGGIATSLNNVGNLTLDQGDLPAAKALFEESLAIARQLGDRRLMTYTLGNLGTVAFHQNDYPVARTLYEECLATLRELEDRVRIAIVLNNLGELTFEQGDYAAARALHEESLAIRRELDDPGGIAFSMKNLGEVAFEVGEFRIAGGLYKEGLAIRRKLGDREGIAYVLEGHAAVLAALGDCLHAARIGGAAQRLREEIGAPLLPNERTRYDRRIAAARTALGDGLAFDRAWKEGRALTLERAIELALGKTVEQG